MGLNKWYDTVVSITESMDSEVVNFEMVRKKKMRNVTIQS